MPQVPYSPVPDIAPTGPAVGPVRIETPPAAFGVTEAEAVRGAGQQAEKSADQMFDTALYVKQLDNETWSKNDFVNQSMKIADKENYLYGLKGQDAVNAAPGVQADIQQIYRNAIANAPNPQAARFLGDQLSRRVAYSLIDIGRHSGSERLRAAGDASVSTVAMGIDEISRRPQDDSFFKNTVASFEHEAQVQEDLGNGKAQINLLKWKNMAWEARFDKLVFDNPNAAQALLDQNKDQIPPAARKNIQAQIKNGEYTIRAAQSFQTQQSKADAEQTVGQIAARNIGTNPESGDVVINPRLYKELSDYSKANPAAEKDAQERITWAQRQQDRQAKGVVVQTDPNTMSRLTGTMFDASNPTRERDVLIAETNGSLSHKDGTWLRTMIKQRDQGDAQTLKDPAFKIATDWARSDIVNPNNLAAFQYEFMTRYLDAVHNNTLKPDDLDPRNLKGMFRQVASKYVSSLTTNIRAAEPETLPTVINQQQYDALPVNASYKGPDGVTRTKQVAPANQPGQ